MGSGMTLFGFFFFYMDGLFFRYDCWRVGEIYVR